MLFFFHNEQYKKKITHQYGNRRLKLIHSTDLDLSLLTLNAMRILHFLHIRQNVKRQHFQQFNPLYMIFPLYNYTKCVL